VPVINLFRSGYDNNHETIHVSGNKPVKEALPELEYTDSATAVNGFQVDGNYILKDGDICTIRLFPKDNNVQAAWAGGLLGFLAGGIPGALIGAGIGAAANAVTEAAGGHSILGGILRWLAPDLPGSGADSPEQLKNIPQLRGAENQSNRNKPIPLVLGKHLFTPMYIGTPYTEIDGEDGEDQYFNALYLLGWGKLEVKDIKLGPVSGLAKNPAGITDGLLLYNDDPKFCDPSFAGSGPKLELRQGPNPEREDGEVQLYPQKVVEERLSIELIHVEEVKDNEGNVTTEGGVLKAVRFSAKNPMRIQVEFTFNGGLISYNEKGGRQDASVSISVQWKKPQEDDDQWKEFGQIGKGQDGVSCSAPVTTITKQKAKIMRFIAERTFSYSEVSGALDRTVELKIFRTNPKAVDDNRTADTVYLTAVRTWCFDPEASEAAGISVPQAPMIEKYRDKTARLGFRIKADGAVQGTIGALNCIVQSYARVWNGTDWNGPEVPTNNPASVALKVLQSPALGVNAYPDKMLDLNSFAEFYEWCDETIIEDGESRKRFTCNGVLTAEKRVDDLLSAVLAAGRGMMMLNGNQYAVLIDKPRENPVMILNSQNVLEAGNQKNFADLPDGFSIKFINEYDGYQETEVYITADGSNKPGPESKIESIEMPFVTDYRQAVKNGWYQLACRYLRPEIWNRKVSIEGYLAGIGDRVEVQDDTIVVGLGEGAAITDFTIKDGIITEIHTDGVFDVTDTAQRYGIKIMQFDGSNPGRIRTIQVPIPAPGVYRSFTVSIPLNSPPPLPHVGDLAAFGVYDRITTPALCFGKKDNGDGTFELTLIPYQEGIYTADSGIIPEYNANITTPQAPAPPGDMPPDPVSKSEILDALSGMDFTGLPAVVYELRPSVHIIKMEDDGTFVPGEISCSQVSTTGDGPPAPSYKILTYITSEDDTPKNYNGPVAAGGWDWIEFILSDSGVELDRERTPVLRNGIPATVYELIPSVSVVSRAQDGITLEPAEIRCSQQAVTGTGTPKPSNKTLQYTTSENSGKTYYSGPVALNPLWEWIEFQLYDGGDLLDRERVLILYQYIPATVYELLPSVSVVKHKYDDAIEPASISCDQVKYTPGLPPAAGGKTLRYITSAGPDTETDYTGGSIPIDSAWAWIEFHLYEGASLLDLERVPVVYDGADGIAAAVIDFANDHKIISCNEVGIPYPGVLPYFNQALFYHSGGGQVVWNLIDPPSGVFIDQNGLITVEANAVLDVSNEVQVSAVWSGKTYIKNFNIVKVVDGSGPIFLNIENDNRSIACGEDGAPLPGALPFTTQAHLYQGNRMLTDLLSAAYFPVSGGGGLIDPMLGNPIENIFPVAPVVTWFLKDPPPGVIINEWNGRITVKNNAELNNSNDITVTAVYEDKEYSDIITISKTLAGESPVFIDMEYQDFSFLCYADGALKPNQLPMTVQAVLYRGRNDISGDASWSLINNPSGISINQEIGLITIASNAGMSESNNITVQAVWRGKVFTNMLRLRKTLDGKAGPPGETGLQGDAAPHYRGKTYVPGNSAGLVGIYTGGVNSAPATVQMMPGDWVAYLGGSAGIWVNGMCMRWTGVSWEQIPVNADGNFDTNPYIAALMDLTEGAGRGTFLSILVRDLIAKTAMIDYLFTHKLRIQEMGGERGALYGGGYDQNGNPSGGSGFYLGTDGVLKAAGGEFSGTIYAQNGEFNGTVHAADGTFTGTINAVNGFFSGDISSGPLSVASESASGAKKSYPAGTSAQTLYNNENIIDGAAVIGEYNGKSIIRITGIMTAASGNIVTGLFRRYYDCSIIVNYLNGGSEVIAQAKYSQLTNGTDTQYTLIKYTSYPLAFTYTGFGGGKVLKLTLPYNTTAPDGSGILYRGRDGHTLMIG
jgi:hypothetical protein